MEKKILIVENEAIIQLWLEEYLKANGYAIAGRATSGEEAIEKAKRLRPDLIISEARLPGTLDGFAAAAQLQLQQDLDIPIVFFTDHDNDFVKEKVQGIRSFRTLTKPIQNGDLLGAIAQLIN